mgnify:CR=1 FL=1
MSGIETGQKEKEPGWQHILRLVLNILIPAAGWFLLCFMGPKLLGFFMPFVVGWIIAMIANPLVRFLERRLRLVRRHSSIVIVAGALALVIGLVIQDRELTREEIEDVVRQSREAIQIVELDNAEQSEGDEDLF